MDRFTEFEEILLNNQNNNNNNNNKNNLKEENNSSSLRNRFETKNDKEESSLLNTTELLFTKEEEIIYNFSKSFLSECNLINTTIIQLKAQIRKLSQKPDQISFSIQPKQFHNSYEEIEEALNICSMNLSVLRNRLREMESETENKNKKHKAEGFISSWFSTQNNLQIQNRPNPMTEHCRLVISFLEGRIGRVTEDLETFKRRQKNRENILNSVQKVELKAKTGTPNKFIKSTPLDTEEASKCIDSTSDHSQIQTQLQIENSEMIEEMSRGLFETLSTTESQILEISRLQSTLQSHLSIQHDQTCRLFEDSQTTFRETKRGNEYLKKSGEDGSVMRRFLVGLIILMSLILLLLHYFN